MRTFREFVLAEMPLANYRVAPFIVKNPPKKSPLPMPFFDQGDRQAIQNRVIQNTCEARLEKSTGHKFNIILLEQAVKLTKEPESVARQGYKAAVERYCAEHNIPLVNHITFAKNGSTGDRLSCWMILHTIGHALFDFNKWQESAITEHLIQMYKTLATRPEYQQMAQEATQGLVHFVTKFFKFRSAEAFGTSKGVKDISELVYELVAEYLWHGYIRHEKVAEPWVKAIGTAIEQSLNHAVGHIIIDYLD